MEPLSNRISVTLEFSVTTFRQIESETRTRADAFFDGDVYELGWIDVRIAEDGTIRVEATVHTPFED